ncbi:MAG: hypothetical protein C4540_01040 [Candidatus Omnitrophota bacterium]|jgi:uncharacterized BrkB/YihY/UPF0761 family membrane protein|nr:MAG: hypothetical protein C4540_01040 [Candidatus Omnitrophota bacterium]
MIFLSLAGIVALTFGILLLCVPEMVFTASKKMNKKQDDTFISVDDQVRTFRVGVALSSILISLVLFFTVYYLIVRYGW